MPGVTLVGIADRDEARVREISAKYGAKAFTDHMELLSQNLDAVSIAVPTVLHKKIALDAISKGVNVLIEKPIADTVNNGYDILDAAKKKGVTVAVGHIERFNPAVQKLKELIDSGALGEIKSIIARRVGAFPGRIRDVNVITDLAVHDIDILNYLTGKEPESISAISGKALSDSKEDHADIFLKYEGVTGFIEVNWITPVKIRKLDVTGTKGYAKLNYVTQELRLYESNVSKSFDEYGDFVVKFGEPKEVVVQVDKAEPLRRELENFIDAVRNHTKPLVSGEDGMKALVIIGDIANSSNTGQQVPYSNGRSLQDWHATSLSPEFMLHNHKAS
jgi:UDP-N-acetylglucosamine 3-dehydrogenase